MTKPANGWIARRGRFDLTVIPGRALRKQCEGKGTQVVGPDPVRPPGSPSLAARIARLAGDDIRKSTSTTHPRPALAHCASARLSALTPHRVPPPRYRSWPTPSPT